MNVVSDSLRVIGAKESSRSWNNKKTGARRVKFSRGVEELLRAAYHGAHRLHERLLRETERNDYSQFSRRRVGRRVSKCWGADQAKAFSKGMVNRLQRAVLVRGFTADGRIITLNLTLTRRNCQPFFAKPASE